MQSMDKAFQASEETTREVRNAVWKFDGTVVLITGAARGQGRSHALAFARAGADLALCDIDSPVAGFYPLGTADELAQTAADCEALGARVHTQVCDVRDAAQVADFVARSVEAVGPIDVAIANAGVTRIQSIMDMEEQDWDAVVDINLKGVYLTLGEVARHQVRAGRPGSLIATGSVHSFTGVPSHTHYVSSKHGVAGFCKALAVELAPQRIRVNYVCPTALVTPMLQALDLPDVPENFGPMLVENTGSWNLLEEGAPPLQAQEITEAMLWLASDSSAFVTGSAIVVDAGFTVK
jgi:NAD(P)-dependent dehydrogenase (short-subunit alcohol dehydrogenase family)